MALATLGWPATLLGGGLAPRDWTAATVATTPPVRTEAAMAYDPGRDRVVLFGGGQFYGAVDDTWEWDGTRWLSMPTPVTPTPATYHAMAHDAARAETVMYLGSTVFYRPSPETWTWNGVTWLKKLPGAIPPDRSRPAMAYDARRQRVVLFGGSAGVSQTLTDTWEWNGSNWVEQHPQTSPPGRSGHAMAYDATRQRIVLFGGDGPAGRLADTWTWDGSNWSRLAPRNSPSARSGHVLAADPARSGLTLFGGNDREGRILADCWEWDGTRWATVVTPTRPPSREHATAAFDEARGQFVLFGGTAAEYRSGTNENRLQDTWLLGAAPRNLPPVADAGTARVTTPGTQVALPGAGTDPEGSPLTYSWRRSPAAPGDGPPVELTGASSSTPTFTPPAAGSYGFELTVSDGAGGLATAQVSVTAAAWQPALPRWARRSPPTTLTARIEPAACYDSTRRRVLVFGGTQPGNGFGLSDLLAWDGADWTTLAVSRPPSARYGPAVAWDGARGRLVLFGGKAGGGYGYVNDETWEWDGFDWAQLSPSSSPSGRANHAMAYDTARRRVVLFGGSTSGQDFLGDTWEFDGETWTRMDTPVAPPGRTYHQMVYDAARRTVVLFGGSRWTPSSSWGVLSDTWEWNGTVWRERQPARWPRARSRHAMGYDASRERVVVAGGTGTQPQPLSDSWEWDGSGWTPTQAPAQPPGRDGAAMAFDAARGSLVLYGGNFAVNAEGDPRDVWELQAAPRAVPPDRSPLASAGAARLVAPGATVGLTAAAVDPDGGTVTYRWRRNPAEPGDGADVGLTGSASASASFTPPGTGTYSFLLEATDPRGSVTTAVVDVFAAGGARAPARWRSRVPAAAPSTRRAAAACFEPAGAGLLLFGGQGVEPLADTWLWQRSAWRALLPAVSPPARTGAALAPEPARWRSLLFGGQDGSGALGDTWEFDGSTWLRRTPPLAPTSRAGHAMAQAPRGDRVVLFGGYGAGAFLADTWEWSGELWLQRATDPAPAARRKHAMALDGRRGKLVLFGGEGQPEPQARAGGPGLENPGFKIGLAPGNLETSVLSRIPAAAGQSGRLDDTWEWDGNGWARLEPPARPPARSGHGMAYEPASGTIVVFGGTGTGGTPLADAWSFDGNTWTAIEGAGPSAREDAVLAADPGRGRLLVFGGNGGGANLADTWEYSPDPSTPFTRLVLAVSAGIDRVAETGTAVTLEGSASGAAGGPFVYSWHRSGGSGPAVTLAGSSTASAQFSPAVTGTYRFTLTATGAGGGSGAASVTVAAAARGFAPAPISLRIGHGQLAGFGTADDTEPLTPEVDAALRFGPAWLPDGEAVTLRLTRAGDGSSRTWAGYIQEFDGRFPRVELERGATYLAELLDGSGQVLGEGVLSDGGPPLARISSWGVTGSSGYWCLGNASFSPRGAPLECSWSLVSAPDGAPAIPLVDCAGFCYSTQGAGTYVFGLTVREPGGRASTVLEPVRYDGAAPVARAGPDVTFVLPDAQGLVPSERTTTEAVLDGRGSSDPEGQQLAYRWRVEAAPAGSALPESAFFSDPFSPVVRVSVPATRSLSGALLNAGTYYVSLTVSDPDSLTATTRLRLTALDPANLVPAADAGLDRTIEVRPAPGSPGRILPTLADPLTPTGPRLDFLRLDGRQSVDGNRPPQPLAYDWTVLTAPDGAPPVSLAPTALPTFVPTVAGLYRFRLVTRNLRFSSRPSEVGVRVLVAGAADTAPVAIARAEGPAGATAPGGAPLQVTAQVDRVVLDATGSTDRETPRGLSYRWLQTAGPMLPLTPDKDTGRVTAVPQEAGGYSFRVTVADPAGNHDESGDLELVAIPRNTHAPVADVRATASGVGGFGEAVPLDPGTPARSLRVTAGTTVTLTASAIDPDVTGAAGSQKLLFSFDQVAGPPVLLTSQTARGPLEATVEFTPTTARVHVFEALLRELDAAGLPTGVEVSRFIRCVVDSPGVRVPVCDALAAPAARELGPCGLARLSATAPGSGVGLSYTWVQREGPPIVLSNPFSAVVTFVVPDTGGDVAQTIRFDCYAEDGLARSEPDPVSIALDPAATRTAQLDLAPGPNLLALPVRPASGATVGDAMRLTSAAFVVTLPGGPGSEQGRFRFFRPGVGPAGDALQGNEGFLVNRAGGALTVAVEGPAWPGDRRSRVLPRGLSLVGYPRFPGTGETAEDLRRRSGAAFVVGTEPGPQGRARFRVHLPGLTEPFPIREHGAYLLSLPASRVLTFPTCGP